MHIMLDLETMGTRPDAPIVAIGAVAFDKDGITSPFYEVIDLAWAVRDGATMSPETVIWWLKQPDEARAAITRRGIEPKVALERFRRFVDLHGGDGMWGNGATFDNVILSETYLRLGMKAPWPFWTDRCYRTIKSVFPAVEMERSGTHHNALDDARSQAEHLIAISAKHGEFL
jgi:exodeoxyribonuclease VIII